MKVLIADKLAQSSLDALRELGAEVDFRPDLAADELPRALGDVNVLVVRSTRVSAAAIAAGKKLALVIRAGAGVNTIDLDAASARGVYVSNCPGKNTDAVAELAIGLLIAADRRVADACESLREGLFRKAAFGKAHGLKGRVLGILGFGRIGRAVAARARGLEMQVMAWSRSLTPERAEAEGIVYADSPLTLARSADAVSIHLAARPETEHLVNEEFLAAMKPGAILINTSRGEVVDTTALKAAIRDKGLRVGLDVYEDEPSGGEAAFADTDLAKMATCTPHIGASTEQAAEAIAQETVRIVKVFLATGRAPNAVNVCARSPATHHLVVRHYNRVGVLAGVLNGLRAEGINVEEMENTIFEGAEAASCTLLLDQPPTEKTLAQLRMAPNILQLELEKR